jgi:hypothetical protein
MDRMKEEIENWKKVNGNSYASQKDLLMYAVSRLEKLHDKLECGESKIADNRATGVENRTAISYLKGAIGAVFAVLLAIGGWLISMRF